MNIKNITVPSSQKSVLDISHMFYQRYTYLSKILQQKAKNPTSIRHCTQQQEVELIGLVQDKSITKNGHIKLMLEDPSGTIPVLCLTNRKLFTDAQKTPLDACILVKGNIKDDVVFGDEIIFPGVPKKEIKKSKSETIVAITSDIELGSKRFDKEKFQKFITFLKKSPKISHLIIAGDLIAGIRADYMQDLEIKNYDEQYYQVLQYLESLPQKIVVCPGNRDNVRLAEPQPEIPLETKNITTVTSPSYVEINEIKFLLYHGNSLGAYKEPFGDTKDKYIQAMMLLLELRHLAPTWGSAPLVPGEDQLIIREDVDVFVTGHTHELGMKQHEHITCLNCAGWTNQSASQKERGKVPDVGKVFLLNTKTREVEVKEF